MFFWTPLKFIEFTEILSKGWVKNRAPAGFLKLNDEEW